MGLSLIRGVPALVASLVVAAAAPAPVLASPETATDAVGPSSAGAGGEAASIRSHPPVVTTGGREEPPFQQAADFPALPDRPTAYLVTVGPGDAVWERFGHNLIWIHDPERAADEAYNYGLFSFEQENFLLRFVQGHMRYWMAGFDVRRQLSAYRSQQRSIRIQELALEPARVRRLHDFLERNERPENRYYRYHYYRDNCSTRVRDALDRVVDGRLEEWARSRTTSLTYRDHTLRQTHGLFWVSIGMHFGLGPSVDHPLTAWQGMFIPMELEAHLRDFTVRSAEGAVVPMVRGSWTYYDAGRPPTPDTTPDWTLSFAGGGLLLTLLLGGLGRAAVAGRDEARKGFLAVAIPWLAAVGLVGLLIGLLWAFTDHVDTHGNLNLWHATPLHLALAVVAWPLSRGRAWARRAGRWLGGGLGVLTVLGLAVQALPGTVQSNEEFLVLLVPANLAVAWVAWRLAEEPGRGGAVRSGGECGERDPDEAPEPTSPT